MKLDILAIVAHPDDAELCAGGTLIMHQKQGLKTGVVDLTGGELGTRGNATTRAEEAANASKILRLNTRENLGLADGFFEETDASLLMVVSTIRKYQPNILLVNAPSDRHPDHGRASALVKRAAFLSGLIKIETGQSPWRPKVVYETIQDNHHHPDIVIDVTPFWEQRMEALLAYRTQFFQGKEDGQPSSPISSQEFLRFVEGRAREFGRIIGVEYGEGFLTTRAIAVNSFTNLY